MNTLEERLESMKVESKDLIFENKNFTIMTIPPSDLSKVDFNDPSYIQHILSFLEVHPVESSTFLESIALHSHIKEYPDCNNMETQIIGFNSTHVYEMSFMFFNDNIDINNIPNNDVATMLNIEGEKVKGHCLIYKSFISNTDYSMKIDTITKDDIAELLISRREPSMIIYEDGDWREERVPDVKNYKKKFFGKDYVRETDLRHMLYSLKILYTESDYGEKVIPEIVDKNIDRLIIYSEYGNMIDNFSKDEFDKIIHLKKKKIFEVDKELLKEKKDDLGRKVINTKYRLLNLMYRNNL